MTEATYRPVVGVHNAAKVVPHRPGTYDLRAPVSWSVMPGR